MARIALKRPNNLPYFHGDPCKKEHRTEIYKKERQDNIIYYYYK